MEIFYYYVLAPVAILGFISLAIDVLRNKLSKFDTYIIVALLTLDAVRVVIQMIKHALGN